MKRLNLGCWKDIREGYINLDKYNYDGVDVICDIENQKLPFKENYFDEILARNILEHISNLNFVISEVHRVLKREGRLIIESPHFTNNFWIDPTHTRGFSIRTFIYYTTYSPMLYTQNNRLFRRFNGKIIFEKRKLMFWNFILEPIVNIDEQTQNFYERSWLRIFPAYKIEGELIK